MQYFMQQFFNPDTLERVEKINSFFNLDAWNSLTD